MQPAALWRVSSTSCEEDSEDDGDDDNNAKAQAWRKAAGLLCQQLGHGFNADLVMGPW
jgi:hypothetical protein